MKGFWIILCLIFGALSAKSQSVRLLNSSSSNVKVSFASVAYYNDSLLIGGTYANEDGIANFILPENCNKIKISCIGYDDTIIKRANLQDTIFLFEEMSLLDEVVVLSNNSQEPFRHLGFKKAKRHNSVISSAKKGGQVVTRIDNPFLEEKKIKAIEFWINKKKTANSGFLKIVFFEIDSLKPGKQIGFELVLSNSELEKKMFINVENHNISLPKEGLFMGIEWMSCLEMERSKDFAVCINKVIGNFEENESIKNQVFVRDKFEQTNWIDLNAFAPFGSFLPAFGLYVYE